ncbi:hypothetical protein [Methanomethylophilus alvi]|uniref:hypothetical protein n=1 Tax=Methanomethylophilus alvi TaxID=1291540 RepID=UPI0037DDBF49
MNAKLTAAAAILVVAIVGLAAFEGSTNSWWSDEEDASLEIQAGGLDLAVENYKLSIDGVDVACEAGNDQDNPTMVDIRITEEGIYLEPGTVVKISYDLVYSTTVSGARLVMVSMCDVATDEKVEDDHIQVEYSEIMGEESLTDGWYFFPEIGEYDSHADVTYSIGGNADLQMNHKYSFQIHTIFVQSKAVSIVDTADELQGALSGDKMLVALSDDIEIDETLSVSKDADVILDLSGHKLNVDASVGILVDGGSLYLTDMGDGSGIIVATGSAVNVVNDGYFTMDGGNISAGNIGVAAGFKNGADSGATIDIYGGSVKAVEFAVWGVNGSSIFIYDGEFTSADNAVIASNGTPSNGPVNVRIEGGTFNCGIVSGGYLACGVFVAQCGNWDIVGGTFNMMSDKATAFVVRSGNVNIDLDNVTVNMNATSDSIGKVGDSTFVKSGHVVAAYYTSGAYGFTEDSTSLIINGEPKISSENVSHYVGTNSAVQVNVCYYYDN